ncbi:MAG: tetratricopeptide repeat protein [Pseudomonadota bacterium]
MPKRSLTFLVAGLALLVAACSSPEELEADYLESGLELLAEGETAKATLSFRNVLRINPNNAEALLALGRIAESQQNLPHAYNNYQAASDADPELIEAHNAYAVLALTANELEIVEGAIAKIEAVATPHADAEALRAAVALRRGDGAAAEAHALAALALDPAHVNATSALAGVLNGRGDVEGAVDVIDTFFDSQGPNVALALLKVQLRAADDDPDGVREAFEELIAFEPDNAQFRIALADFHRSNDAFGDAETVLRQAVDQLSGNPTATVALVQMVFQREGVDAAVAEADAAIARNPEALQNVSFLVADLFTQAQRYDEARERLQAILDDAGETTARGLDARAALASIALASGDADGARTQVDAALEDDQQHRGLNYLSAVLHLGAGNPAEAIPVARSTLGRDPNWVPGLKVLAEAHLRRDDQGLAIDILSRIHQLAPRDLTAAEALARLLTARGDYDAAMAVWDTIVAQVDDPGPALANAAQLAIRSENWARASRDIDRLLDVPETAISGSLLAGSLRTAQGDYGGGREWFERASALDPEAAQPLFGLVQTYLAEDDVASAIGVIRERIDTGASSDVTIVNLLGQLYARNGQIDEAIATYEEAILAQPQWATPYLELAAVLESEGQTQAALDMLERGIAAGGDPGQLLLAKAFTEQRVGREVDAIATYDRLLELGSTNDVVVNNFAALVADFAYEDQATLDRALELAKRFTTSSEAYFLDTLGWLHFRNGDPARALSFLRRAAAILPDDAHIRYHVGASLAAADEHRAAEAELVRALPEGADYVGVDHARTLLDEVRRKLAEDAPSEGAS